VGAGCHDVTTRVAADLGWTPAEAWVWERTRVGEIADFATLDGATLDPANANGWTARRRIRASVLRAMLLLPPWRDALLPEGLRLVGAQIEGELALTHATVTRQLWLERCRISGPLRLEDTEVQGWFSLEGAWLAHGIDLGGARLRSQVSFDDATFGGDCIATLASFGNVLRLRRVRGAGAWRSNGARVTGDLDMADSRFAGPVTFDSVRVEGMAVFDRAVFRRGLMLRGARIDGSLSAVHAAIARPRPDEKLDDAEVSDRKPASRDNEALDLGLARVGGWVFLRGARLTGSATAGFANIGGSLDLRGEWRQGARSGVARFPSVDLSGAEIKGQLLLGAETAWRADATLNLRSAHVAAVQDGGGAWPRTLHLAGFAYDRLGGFAGEDYSDYHRRPNAWFLDWLRRTRNLQEAHQPHDRTLAARIERAVGRLAGCGGSRDIGHRSETYERLARALRAIGRNDAADEVLFTSRDIARRNAQPWRALGLWLSRWVIGYGIGRGYLNAAIVAMAIALVGMGVIAADRALLGPQPGLEAKGTAWMFFAALDHLLPIVTLDKEFGDLLPARLLGWGAKLWFWCTALFGWVLGSFLVAGLAGLTQKS